MGEEGEMTDEDCDLIVDRWWPKWRLEGSNLSGLNHLVREGVDWERARILRGLADLWEGLGPLQKQFGKDIYQRVMTMVRGEFQDVDAML